MKGSIFLQFIFFIYSLYLILTIPEIYNEFIFILIFIPLFIGINIIKTISD
jgi:hypothetical protein